MTVLDRDHFDLFRDELAEHNAMTGEALSHRDWIRYCRLHNRQPADLPADGGPTRSAPARTVSLDEHQMPAGACERTVQE